VILYLDSSSLVKRYTKEAGSAQVNDLIDHARIAGTTVITCVEVTAALAKATRMGVVPREEALAALKLFRRQWPDFVRLHLDRAILSLAEAFAWEHGLRGYDAVHLATAASWQQTMGEPVTLATFDQQLWQAAQKVAVAAWPQELSRPNRG
jgi:predicted nucleic acid-binding protein